MNHNKILVIGAGIAGITVCYWLKQYGFNPTLIEKSKHLRAGGYDIDIRGVAVDIVKKMGIYDDICAKRTSLLTTRYVDANGQILSEEYNEKVHFSDGDDVELLRGDLIQILLKTLTHIPCHFDTEITNLSQNDSCVEVTFQNGKVEQYDLVIGADGLHSSTRKMSFSAKDCSFFNLGYYFGIFSIPNYLNLNRTKVMFTKDQKIISVDSDKDPNHALVNFCIKSDKSLADISNKTEQIACLKSWGQNLGWESDSLLTLMEKSEDFYFDTVAQIKMDTWAQGRVALLGDAAYCASLFSGMGCNLALIGAYILAGELKSANGDYTIAFQRYRERMHPLANAAQDLAVWMGECFLPEEGVSKKALEHRSSDIIEKIKMAANTISLPHYT